MTFALNLVPFAGIAFMWFLGVLRDRLGAKEDKFFATVFLGSGLMFLGMLFVAASAIGSLVLSYTAAPNAQLDASYTDLRTQICLRHHAYLRLQDGGGLHDHDVHAFHLYPRHPPLERMLGYASAAVILIGGGYCSMALFVFPSGCLWSASIS